MKHLGAIDHAALGPSSLRWLALDHTAGLSGHIWVHIYRHAFRYFAMGYASALAVVLFLAVFMVTWAIFWSARAWLYEVGDDRRG
jgi:ABC-type sugar transport system permease subunit